VTSLDQCACLESETPRRLAPAGGSAPRPSPYADGGSGVAELPGTSGAVTPAIALNQVWSRHRACRMQAARSRSPRRTLQASPASPRCGRRPPSATSGRSCWGARHAEWLAVPCRCSVDSTPSVDPTTGTIFVGSGNALRPTGQLPGDHAHAAPLATSGPCEPRTVDGPQSVTTACRAGLAVGNLQGGEDVRRGLLGENEYAPDQRRGRPGRLPLVSGRQQLHHTGHRRPLWHEPEPDHRGWRTRRRASPTA